MLVTNSKQSAQRPKSAIANAGSHLRMSLAIVGVDKIGGSLMAGIPEARFMNAPMFWTRDEGRPRMAVAGLDISELHELALLLVAVGALSGFLAGLFSIGGGAILVPVFYECFRLAGVPLEVRMPLCVGTSLAIIIPTSIRSFRAHYARGAVDMEILKTWWLPIVIGVIAGSITARYAPERLFKIVFVGVAWSAAARLLLARDNWKFGDDLPKGPLMQLYGIIVGLLSTLMRIGG